VLVLLGACGSTQVRGSHVALAPGSELKEFILDEGSRYLVDPNTRTCALVYMPIGYESTVAIPVDCALLAANVPDAAKVITWTSKASRSDQCEAHPVDVPGGCSVPENK